MIRETQQLFTELGVEIEPEEKVENLKTSQKQLLEISKALFFQAKLLILDEPTTSLNNDEVEHLFQIIRRLKEKGTAFIFISHKMPEIFRIADRYTVLRNGEFIKSGKLSEITQEEVTGLMVGEKFSHQEIYQKRELGENVLELNGLSGHGFSNVNLTVKKRQYCRSDRTAGIRKQRTASGTFRSSNGDRWNFESFWKRMQNT